MDRYKSALEAAGAKVLAFESFGSYQGDWWALVEVSGQKSWVNGSYGSCSGCDAFEAEFGYSEEPWCDAHAYKENTDCLDCQEKRKAYDAKLRAFGEPYLGGSMTQDAAIAEASRNLEWDSDAKEALDFIIAHAA